jgi:prepilin-type N-terminal cleavage/methylation domain-containing protein
MTRASDHVPDHDSDASEKGFTLIELLISMMLFVIVAAIVATMFASMSSSSKTVDSLTGSATSAQLAASSVERGVRNSSDFLLTNPTGTDQLLVARTALGGSTLTWVCSAWYYSAANGGSLRYTTSPTAIPAAPTASALAGWTLLDTGLTPTSGNGIFSATPGQLTLAFTEQSTGAGPLSISGTAVSRAGSTGTPACY